MHTRHLGRLATATVGALVLLAAPTRSQAQVGTTGCLSVNQCTLTELFAGASITVDDKKFKGWGLEKLDASAGAIPNLGLITVEGLSSLLDPDPLNPGPGLRFHGNGQLSVTGVQYLDLRLDFRVAVTNPSYKLKDASAAIPSATLTGSGRARVNEFLTIAGGSLGLGQMRIDLDNKFAWQFPPPPTDQIKFPPLSEAYVEKNFFLEGQAPGDSASIHQLDQHYSQMPEPGELLMLGCGSAFLVLLSRPRARRANHSLVGGIS
jgi:hypothetical protein